MPNKTSSVQWVQLLLTTTILYANELTTDRNNTACPTLLNRQDKILSMCQINCTNALAKRASKQSTVQMQNMRGSSSAKIFLLIRGVGIFGLLRSFESFEPFVHRWSRLCRHHVLPPLIAQAQGRCDDLERKYLPHCTQKDSRMQRRRPLTQHLSARSCCHAFDIHWRCWVSMPGPREGVRQTLALPPPPMLGRYHCVPNRQGQAPHAEVQQTSFFQTSAGS